MCTAGALPCASSTTGFPSSHVLCKNSRQFHYPGSPLPTKLCFHQPAIFSEFFPSTVSSFFSMMNLHWLRISGMILTKYVISMQPRDNSQLIRLSLAANFSHQTLHGMLQVPSAL